MLPNREKPSGDAQNRADRTFPGEVAIAAAADNQASRIAVGVKVLLVEVSNEAVKRGNKVPAVNRAVKA